MKRKAKRRKLLVISIVLLVSLIMTRMTAMAFDNTPQQVTTGQRTETKEPTQQEMTAVKVDESKERYELPQNTSYIILKQAKGTLAVWSVEAIEESNQNTVKDQLLQMAKAQDGSIKGDEKVIFISGSQSFDLGEQLGENNWGIYNFVVTDSGEVILTCDASKISHIVYITTNPDPDPDPDPDPVTEGSTNEYIIPKTGENDIHTTMAGIIVIISMIALICLVWNKAKCKQ